MPVVLHLTDEQLRAFAQGEMTLTEFEQAEQHLTECDACCQRIAAEPENTLLSLARAAMTLNATRHSGSKASPGIPTDLANHPRYKILEAIGSGGMGAVFKAEHRLMQRTVALKLVHPWLLSNRQAVERFEREVRMAARLSHPNIVVAYDADKTDDRHFLVMEYVEGETLQQRIDREGPASVATACDWIAQVASGLDHASAEGMTHRDIKPQNLMITRNGHIRILDFGLSRLATDPVFATPSNEPAHASELWASKLPLPKVSLPRDAATSGQSTNWDTNCCSIARTDASTILGTPDYIAPEQIDSSAKVDIRADIYSLGCTLYYLLTGKPPFHATSIVETLHAQRHACLPDVQLIRPDVPDRLTQLLARMTAKRVEDRISSPREVCDAIEQWNSYSAGSPQSLSVANDMLQIANIVPATNVTTTRNTASQRLRDLPGTGSRRKLIIVSVIALSAMIISGLAPFVIYSKAHRYLVALPADGLWYADYEELVKAAQKLSGRVQLVFAGTVDRPSNVLSTSKPGIAVPDVLLSNQLKADDYDGMIFLGYLTQEFSPQSGPTGAETSRLIREFQMQKKVLGGLCAGQRILAQHGALRGKRVAPGESIRDEEILVEGGTRDTQAVVADGLVVTAASADHAENFLKKMIQAENH